MSEEKVLCPLNNDYFDPVDCMENQDIKEELIPAEFKVKTDWKTGYEK